MNSKFEAKATQPKWAPAPLLKSHERSFPELGFPRETDSLCPECVKDLRARIINGEEDWRTLLQGKPGEVRARIIERDGEVWMEKTCAKHGRC